MPLLAILFFIVQYWLDKYNLLKRSSNPVSLTKNLTQLMIQVMEIDIIIFCLGNLITMVLIEKKQPPIKDSNSNFPFSFIQLSYIALIIAIFYKIIVEIASRFTPSYQNTAKAYGESRSLFRHRYWT